MKEKVMTMEELKNYVDCMEQTVLIQLTIEEVENDDGTIFNREFR